MLNEEMVKEYKNNVIENMKNTGLSLRKLAKGANLSPATISGIVNNERDIKLTSLLYIADFLKMSLDDLTGFKQFSTTYDGDPTIDDYADMQKKYYQMQHSLSTLYASISGLSICGQYNEDTERIIKYVQENIGKILKGKCIEGELPPLE